MNLYLSSYGIGDRSDELKALAKNSRAAVIVNALDNMPSDVRASVVRREFEDLKSLGFDPIELDLRDYFDSDREIAGTLEGVGLVWVTGGNTFLLRKAFRASEIVYGGYSAGACILSPTLRGLEIVDDAEASAERYPKITIWEGLGLIPFSIAPHYKSDHSESERVDATVEYFIEHKIPFIALRDGEVEVTRVG
jgi:dipeptidase E